MCSTVDESCGTPSIHSSPSKHSTRWPGPNDSAANTSITISINRKHTVTTEKLWVVLLLNDLLKWVQRRGKKKAQWLLFSLLQCEQAFSLSPWHCFWTQLSWSYTCLSYSWALALAADLSGRVCDHCCVSLFGFEGISDSAAACFWPAVLLAMHSIRR